MSPARPRRDRRRSAQARRGRRAGLFVWLSLVPLCAAGPALAGADFVLVEKARRQLTLYERGAPIRVYPIALGGNPVGPKQQEGDQRTPEGRYVIDTRKLDSNYHRALHISYPNEEDRRRAAERGVSPGDSIMIHGLPKGWGWLGRLHLRLDWTDGCIAVSNEDIEEIWSLVEDGTRIEILP
jgi:murein L,D-transpeptidase YafK